MLKINRTECRTYIIEYSVSQSLSILSIKALKPPAHKALSLICWQWSVELCILLQWCGLQRAQILGFWTPFQQEIQRDGCCEYMFNIQIPNFMPRVNYKELCTIKKQLILIKPTTKKCEETKSCLNHNLHGSPVMFWLREHLIGWYAPNWY